MVDSTANPLLGRDLAELQVLAEELQEPSYRAQQLFESIYGQRVSSVEQISTLPARLRQNLALRGISIGWPTIDSKFQSTETEANPAMGAKLEMRLRHSGRGIELRSASPVRSVVPSTASFASPLFWESSAT